MVNIPLLILPGVILAWALHRCWRTSPRNVEPAWRSYAAIGASGLVAWSSFWLIVYGILVEMGTTGTCEYWVCGLIALSGFSAAPLGFVASLAGNGKLRWPACGLSAFMTLFWLAAGLGA